MNSNSFFDPTDLRHRYVIGMDLGTTNTVVAYVDLGAKKERAKRRALQFFEIPQLVAPGEVARQASLPSFCYLPGAHELPEGGTALPWDPRRSYVIGEMAQAQGARVPGRLVASAKSWLCHEAVDRTAAILPWGTPDEVPKVSPVEASRRYLQHVREAWDAERPEAPFAEQLLILTVPASFDEVARELTVEAARKAGLYHVTLLEEPLAAFYAWVAEHEHTWQPQMQAGQLILVCDIGGGTSDFSIVGLREEEGGLRFDRLAVGDHLMLGGDNMDYALGRHLEAEMAGAPGKLDAQRWHQLVHGARQAKERLLAATDEDEVAEVMVAGTGGRLIAGMLKGTLVRADVQRLLLDGFFPDVALGDPLEEHVRKGLSELGLPYVHDPAITRHLAAFWRRAQPYLYDETGREVLYPDYILFNGGVMIPASLRDRVKDIVRGWFAPMAGSDWQPTELDNPRLDQAVAMGAAYYGLVRLGEGIRVGSGSPRAYYVGVAEQQATAETQTTAVCLVPRGAEEGFVSRLNDQHFEALANQPVTFHLFSSTTRSGDALGDVVQLASDEAEALPPVRSVLQFGKKITARTIPIGLAVRLTEVGTLELWCESRHTDHRWQLQFDVRRESLPEDAATPALTETLDPAWIAEAQAMLEDIFRDPEPPKPEYVWHHLEATLHTQPSDWPIPVLRKLADTLLSLPRKRTVAHEALWFDLMGYCLRPGYGDPVDEWRIQQAWKLHLEGLHFPGKVDARIAWWTFWRRVAGGLPGEKQAQIYHEVRPYLQLKVMTKKQHRIYPRRMASHEQQEAWRALAHFERLPPDIKATLGRLLLQKMKQNKLRDEVEMWALSRLGARNPAYGSLDSQTPPDEVETWVKSVLTSYPPHKENVGYALVHLTRRTDDRKRDVDEDTRQQVYRWLRKLPNEDRLRALLEDATLALSPAEQVAFIGEPLPPSAHAVLDPHGLTVATLPETVPDSHAS